MPSIIPVRRNVLYRVANAVAAATTTFDPAQTTADLTLSGGNLVATGNGALDTKRGTRSVANHTSGKYYAEFTVTLSDVSNMCVGVINTSFTVGTSDPGSVGANYFANGFILLNGVSQGSFLAYTDNDVIGIAADFDNNKVWFRKNATGWNNDVIANQNPATNTGGISIAALAGSALYIFAGMQRGGVFTANFGATTYAQTRPSGFGNW